MKIDTENILDNGFPENLPKDNPAVKFGILMAKVSFLLGSILLISFLTIKENGLIFILGICYTVIAFIINAVFFIYLIFKSGTPDEKEYYRRTAGIMLINLPIAFCFLVIVLRKFT